MILNGVILFHQFDYELLDEYCKVILNDFSSIIDHDNHDMVHVVNHLIKP